MENEPLPATAAVVLAGAPGLPPPTTQYPEADDEADSEDDADDALLPPGPVDPERCTVRLPEGLCLPTIRCVCSGAELGIDAVCPPPADIRARVLWRGSSIRRFVFCHGQGCGRQAHTRGRG